MKKRLIQFDWAVKRLLRNKSNFDILEGFLTELLNENIKIKQILESESNQELETDKHNRVDILVENESGELVIIEVQNSREFDYFHRILYGTSKIISEHITKGEPYSKVKKVISITIAYFDLGQGKDYIYHGKNIFRGIHKHDILTLSEGQEELYNVHEVADIFPEYWIIKVNNFSNRVKSKLDEWIYFFKNDEIRSDFSAKGIKEAGERLDEMKLSEKDRKSYNAHLQNLHEIASRNFNREAELHFGIQDEKERLIKIALHGGEFSDQQIAQLFDVSVNFIEKVKNK